MHVVDRRKNPKSKSLGNRQRFMRRAKTEIREAVRDALKRRKVAEVEGSEEIRIRSKSLREPSFGLGRNSGTRDFVLPGNKEYKAGDVVSKPEQGGGGGGGKEGSADGEGQDDFVFTLTRDEFLDVFFEDLKLPNLVKKKLKSVRNATPMRAGYSPEGSPARLNRLRTMRFSLARRIALRRPSEAEIKRLEEEIAQAEKESEPQIRIDELKKRLNRLMHLRKVVGFIDPLDLQYNRFERRPKPATQAVMFCLMDTSASMTEPLKDLAKRFFMLLHLFLTRHYREVQVVFIRHTSTASEVDEETFFRGTDSGGTVISTAFEEMLKVVRDRYPIDDWNIYAAQASDGHNYDDDMPRTLSMLQDEILPLCQYFAYIEVADRQWQAQAGDSVVWNGYRDQLAAIKNFAMRRAASPGEIYPVFHELFSSDAEAA